LTAAIWISRPARSFDGRWRTLGVIKLGGSSNERFLIGRDVILLKEGVRLERSSPIFRRELNVKSLALCGRLGLVERNERCEFFDMWMWIRRVELEVQFECSDPGLEARGQLPSACWLRIAGRICHLQVAVIFSSSHLVHDSSSLVHL
jgi:hypothetical protein